MGKLLRKKPADGKKKRKQDNDSAQSLPDSDRSDSNVVTQPGNSTKPLVVKRPSQPLAPAAKQKAGSGFKIAFIENGIQFLREVKVELKKVTWPSRKQTLGTLLVVLVLVFLIAFFLGIVDIGLTGIIRLVL